MIKKWLEANSEIIKDIFWGYLARKRERKGSISYLSHEEVWKKYGL